ncbi:MAG: hypothetical protein WC373_01745 [Smithella sp.]|jgi:hypothetical protein
MQTITKPTGRKRIRKMKDTTTIAEFYENETKTMYRGDADIYNDDPPDTIICVGDESNGLYLTRFSNGDFSLHDNNSSAGECRMKNDPEFGNRDINDEIDEWKKCVEWNDDED